LASKSFPESYDLKIPASADFGKLEAEDHFSLTNAMSRLSIPEERKEEPYMHHRPSLQAADGD
jgi:hypothetical protein